MSTQMPEHLRKRQPGGEEARFPALPIDLIGPPDEKGCRHWLGYIHKSGYGIYKKSGKRWRAHRLAYAFVHGEIPDDREVEHRCRVRDCVNPDHLRLATRKQNQENRGGPQSNSKSGIRGVTWSQGKWRVQVTHNRVAHFGGRYDDIAEAEQAAIALRNQLFTYNGEEHD